MSWLEEQWARAAQAYKADRTEYNLLTYRLWDHLLGTKFDWRNVDKVCTDSTDSIVNTDGTGAHVGNVNNVSWRGGVIVHCVFPSTYGRGLPVGHNSIVIYDNDNHYQLAIPHANGFNVVKAPRGDVRRSVASAIVSTYQDLFLA